jgi:hypothetical protein
MNTENKINPGDIILECPHCRVCSILLGAEEYALVEAGQQMIEVCQVCGKEVVFNGGELQS